MALTESFRILSTLCCKKFDLILGEKNQFIFLTAGES